MIWFCLKFCLKLSNHTHFYCITTYIITLKIFKFQEKNFLFPPVSYGFVPECIRILLARQVQWISIRWAIDTIALWKLLIENSRSIFVVSRNGLSNRMNGRHPCISRKLWIIEYRILHEFFYELLISLNDKNCSKNDTKIDQSIILSNVFVFFCKFLNPL